VDEKKMRILKVAVESKDKGTKIKKVEWTDAAIGELELTVEEAAFEGEALAPEKEARACAHPDGRRALSHARALKRQPAASVACAVWQVWSVLRPGSTFQVAGCIKEHKPKPPACCCSVQ
jgi:hypothetical protein